MKTTKKLSGSTYMRHLVKIIKAESVMIVTTGSGERRMRNFFFFTRYRVSVLQDERDMGMDGSHSCTTM